MTGHGDVPLAVEAMKAGAVDFIEKPFDDEVLLAAIKTALSRRARDSEREARLAEVRDRLKTLSEREREVLERLVAGKPNKMIAYELGISARTVEDLPRQRDDQDAGRQPLRAGPHGAPRGRLRLSPTRRPSSLR